MALARCPTGILGGPRYFPGTGVRDSRRGAAESELRGEGRLPSTNLERRIQRIRPALQVKDTEARPESWVICELADRLQAQGFHYLTAGQVMEEIASLTPIYAGVSSHRLEEEGKLVLRTNLESPQPTQVLHAGKEYSGIQWPCPAEDAPGTGVLYSDGFSGQRGLGDAGVQNCGRRRRPGFPLLAGSRQGAV